MAPDGEGWQIGIPFYRDFRHVLSVSAIVTDGDPAIVRMVDQILEPTDPLVQ
jgi:hypothetical protein